MRPNTFLKALVLIASLSTWQAMAYNTPTGIPEPIWGSFHPINTKAPAWPSGWPSSTVPGYYYIDNTHPNATDSNNTYGTPNKPRYSLPEKTYNAGDYIEIHGGNYSGGGQIIITANGTEANPVWIRGTANSMPTITGQFILKGSYVVVEYLKFRNNGATLQLRPHNNSTTHHAVIRHNDMKGSGTSAGFGSAISVYGLSSSQNNHNIVIYNNTIAEYGDDSISASENDFHGVGVPVMANNVWVLDNTIYNVGGDSIQVGTASTNDVNRVHHIYIGRNKFYSNHENAIDVKESDYVVMSENICYGFKTTNSSAGEAVIIHNEADNVWAINNTIYDSVYGLITTGSTETHFIGNVIYDISGAAIHFRGASTGSAINNTIYNYNRGIQLVQGGGSTGYRIYNNILSGRYNSSSHDVIVSDPNTASKSTMDHNIIHHTSGERIDWNSGTTESLAGFVAKFGKCGNCYNRDPNFTDPGNKKFTITGISDASNNGLNIDVYAKYLATFGVPIDRDISGRTRLMGISYDIGAHEGVALSPPKNVTVTK